MPSLIYITRIQSPSAELTHALESSGAHVKSFGPGEITADECVLVMTSEAVLAGVGRPGLESRGTPPLDAIPKHLGADAAIWNYIKTGKLSESSTVEAKAVLGQQASVSMTVPVPRSLGFVASQAGVRALAASQILPAPLNKLPQANTSGAGTSGLQPPRAADEKSSKRFWQPVVVVAVLSIFAVMLLAGRDPILPARGDAAVGNRKPVDGAVSGEGTASSVAPPTKPSNPASEARPHISDYDFVAEDYTTHFDQHSRPAATAAAPNLRREAPKRSADELLIG